MEVGRATNAAHLLHCPASSGGPPGIDTHAHRRESGYADTCSRKPRGTGSASSGLDAVVKTSKATGRHRIAAGVAATAALVLALWAGTGSGGHAQARAELPEGAFAVIDGEVVPQAVFEDYFAQYARSKLYHGGSAERFAQLRAEASERFVIERLLLREAERRGLAGDPESVDRDIEGLRARYADSATWTQVEPRLPALRQALLDGTKVAALLAEVERIDDPDEATLRRFYDDNLALFTTPRGARLGVILVGVPPSASTDEWRAAEVEADALLTRLGQGADFGELARRVSTHDSAAKGGDMGAVHEGEFAPVAQAAIDRIVPGGVTPPIRVLEGYVLFKLIDRFPPAIQDFEAVRERTLGLYRRRLSQEQRDRFVATLREKAVVTVGEPGSAATGTGDRPAQ